MKMIYCLVTCFVTLHSYAQSDFQITGRLIGKDTGKIVMWYTDDSNRGRGDTTFLDRGRFNFSGRVRGATEGVIFTDLKFRHFDEPSVIRFILEPRSIHITKTMGDTAATITGSYAQAEKDLWDQKKAHLVREEASMNAILSDLYKSGTGQTAYGDSIRNIAQAVRAARYKMDINYLVDHPQSYLSCFLLGRLQRWIPVDSVALLYDQLADSVRQSSLGFEVLEYVYPLTNDQAFRQKYPLIDTAFTGKLAAIRSEHDFRLKDSSGKLIDLARFKGKYLLIDAWTSWCPGCIHGLPVWNALVKQYDPKRIQFVTVSLDTELDAWKKALRKHQPAGINLVDTTSFHGLFAVYNKILWVGKYIMVDPNGRILTYDIEADGEEQWKKIIDSYIKN